jgi:tryptophan synthase alpha chain
VRITDVLEIARQLRAARPACGIIIFTYVNPVVRMGMKKFCATAKGAGADGVLLTDMIVEEADEYLTEMKANDLAPIFLAAPTSTDVRLKAIAEASRGFVYAISRVGITGTQQTVAGDASDLVTRLRKFTEPLGIPIAVGFGISNAEHVAAVGQFADAAIIGSALVALIEKSSPAEAPAAIGNFIAELRR